MKTLREFAVKAAGYPTVGGQDVKTPVTSLNNDPNATEHSFNGLTDDLLGAIMDGKTEMELRARYGDHWQELAAMAVKAHIAVGPRPSERPAADPWINVDGHSPHALPESAEDDTHWVLVSEQIYEGTPAAYSLGLAATMIANGTKNAVKKIVGKVCPTCGTKKEESK